VAFGFGRRPSSRDLPGAATALRRSPVFWKPATSAAVSLGFEMAVSRLQLAAAMATIANDGVRFEARLVLDERAEVCAKVIDTTIARALRGALATSVSPDGTIDGLSGSRQVPFSVDTQKRIVGRSLLDSSLAVRKSWP